MPPTDRNPAAPRLLPLALLALAAGLALPAPALARPWHAAPPAASAKSTAMQIAEGFIAMINDGSPEAVTRFETAHRAAAMLAATPLPERINRVAKMHEEFGTLTIDQATPTTAADDKGVSLICKASKGQIIAMDFEFEAVEGGGSGGGIKLKGVMLNIGGEDVRPMPLTPEARTAAIEEACKAIDENYVYPEVAAKMTAKVRGKLTAGQYDSIKTESALARAITEDFRSISHDRHLGFTVNPVDRGGSQASHHDMAEGGADEQARRGNYAFRKVEVLDGNIGYVRFDLFIPTEGARKAASAAMGFVANADAIVFDMRHNGGGSPEMIQYITSYLFDAKTHLNDMIDRHGKTVEEYWTLPEVPGSRIPSTVPIYILTSNYTFSGAEEFTYNLKNLKRATVIGETTGGGAHPVSGHRLSDRFVMMVPFMRASNPITKTNWEGTGVEPDIKTTADEALDRAIAEARKKLTATRK